MYTTPIVDYQSTCNPSTLSIEVLLSIERTCIVSSVAKTLRCVLLRSVWKRSLEVTCRAFTNGFVSIARALSLPRRVSSETDEKNNIAIARTG